MHPYASFLPEHRAFPHHREAIGSSQERTRLARPVLSTRDEHSQTHNDKTPSVKKADELHINVDFGVGCGLNSKDGSAHVEGNRDSLLVGCVFRESRGQSQ